jgi:Mrp family chromosome partitioning ATPase
VASARKPITRGRAIRIAVAAMRRELQVIAFDANMHEHYGARYPQAEAAARRRQDLLAAIEQLEKKMRVKVIP